MNLIFFDIDGTLANGREVPLSAQKAVRELRKNGDLVWICTGRALSYAKRNFYMYANGYICSNGREGYTCCEKIYDHPLSEEQKLYIQKKLDAVGAGYAFFASKQGYYYGPEEGFEVMAQPWDPGFLKKGEDLSSIHAYNFDIWFKDAEHYREIEEALDGFAILNPHGPHPTADVTVLGIDKGTALKATAEYMHVPIENTYAFGDGMNDICMFREAGHSIAMGNGQQALKDAAEYITTDINDDGVWNGLKHYGLI